MGTIGWKQPMSRKCLVLDFAGVAREAEWYSKGHLEQSRWRVSSEALDAQGVLGTPPVSESAKRSKPG